MKRSMFGRCSGRGALLGFLMLVLPACTPGLYGAESILEDFSFEEGTTKGAMIVGVEGLYQAPDLRISLTWTPLLVNGERVSESQQPHTWVQGVDIGIWQAWTSRYTVGGRDYFITLLPAGRYALAEYTVISDRAWGELTNRSWPEAFTFDVTPGEVTYVGNLALTVPDVLRTTGVDRRRYIINELFFDDIEPEDIAKVRLKTVPPRPREAEWFNRIYHGLGDDLRQSLFKTERLNRWDYLRRRGWGELVAPSTREQYQPIERTTGW